MTEAEWLACRKLEPMFDFLRGKTSDRKRRLFACACVRRVWVWMADERSEKAVQVAEWFAEQSVDVDVLRATGHEADEAAYDVCLDSRDCPFSSAVWNASLAAAQTAAEDFPEYAAWNVT